MNKVFTNILVSSPNNGGLSFIGNGKVYMLDNFNTTGLFINNSVIYRGLQKEREVIAYNHKETKVIKNIDDVHDILVHKNHIYTVNTEKNKIIKFTKKGKSVKSWKYGDENDSCHINCLGVWNDKVVFSAFGDFKKSREYKDKTIKAGYVKDLISGKIIIQGLSQPHSLCSFGKNLLLANSECCEIVEFSPLGARKKSKKFDGYTRGIHVTESVIYVGLSRSRNIEQNKINTSTIVAVDTKDFNEIGRIELPFDEIYNILHFENLDTLVNSLATVCSATSANLCKNIEDSNIQNQLLNRETDSLKTQLQEQQQQLITKSESYKMETDSLKTQLQEQQQQLITKSESYKRETDSLKTQLQEYTQQIEVVNLQMQDKKHQLTKSYSRASELEQQLQVESASKLELQSRIDELKNQNHTLAEEYSQLKLDYNKEKLTIARPIYRNVYKVTGATFRNTMPSKWVESLKKIVPNPEGIQNNLTYKMQLSVEKAIPHELLSTMNNNLSSDIFILSIIDFDFRYQRPQHIAKELADSGRRVFYVEMGLADKEFKLIKRSDNLYCVRLSGKNIEHIQPYTGQPDSEQLQKWVLAFYQFCDAFNSTSYKQIIIQHPFWWQLARHLPPEFQITFDCMDDISGFSNTEQFLLDLEHELLTKCDKLVVSSKHLYNKYKHYQAPTIIRNATDLKHFSKPAKEIVHPKFFEQYLVKEAENVIKVGYVGAVAEWFDTDLLEEVAKKEPGIEFHICGEVSASKPMQLGKIKNIHLHGEISYTDVPGFLHEMDVLIIPFKIVPIIQACDPVKFYEYSAIGKPTVTTPLPELSRAGDLAFFAANPLEFAEQIHNAYKQGKTSDLQNKLKEYATNNTWQHRTERFVEVLEDAPKVSIIILSYGDPELTKAVLSSLYEKGPSYPNMEIIIVDNGSSYDAVSDIKTFSDKHPNVTIIENEENLGFAKGNNVGLEAATGEYVMLLNNDTVITPGAVHAMVRHLVNNPEIGAVGPLTNNIGNEAKLFVEYEDMEQMRSVARSATTGYRDIYTNIPVVAYFAVMFRKQDLKIFGLLPEEYGRGMFEDDDHCMTIKSHGYTCALAEDAFIHHHLSATFSKIKDEEKNALFEKNKAIFEKKWGPWGGHKYRNVRTKPSLLNN